MTTDVCDNETDKEPMDPKEERTWSAPGVDVYGQPLPPVDERLAPPETRVEYIGGVEYFAAPADEPHGHRHNEVSYVVRAHVAQSYTSAVDMLTRTDEASDFAPDVSVYPSERDPAGRRQIEELAFEIASEQSISVPTRKARELARRGVRRIFCILVKQGRVLEWSREADGWKTMPETSIIEDKALARPLPIATLLEAVELDDEVARALIAKGNAVIEESLAEGMADARAEGIAEGRAQGIAEGRAQGIAEGLQASVVAILRSRGLHLTAPELNHLHQTQDLELLTRWTVTAGSATNVTELFGGSLP